MTPAGRTAVRVAAVGLAVLVATAGPAHAQAVTLDSAGPGTALGLRVVRTLNHVAMALTVGFLLLPTWLRRGVAAAGPGTARPAAWAGLAWSGTALALFVLGVSNAAARPLPEALSTDLLTRFADTRFGLALLLQALAAVVVALVAAVAAVARGRSGASVALGAAVLGGLAPAWWGHAGTADAGVLAVASAWVHVTAAALWVGGLAALLVVVVQAGAAGAADAAGRYSGLAAWSLAGVLLTGVVNTLVHMSSPALLVDTTWGRLVVGKVVLILAIGALGYLHRTRSIPLLRRGGAGGAQLFRRVAAVELVLMLVALGVASTMSSGMPADAEAASRIQTLRTALGDGEVEITVDPARVGRNEVHLYLYDADGALLPVESATMVMAGPATRTQVDLIPTGPGHYTGPAVQLTEEGRHRITVEVVHEGETRTATAAIPIR